MLKHGKDSHATIVTTLFAKIAIWFLLCTAKTEGLL